MNSLLRRFRWRSAVLAAALVMLAASAAWAHSFNPAVLDVRERGLGIFDVVWKIPLPMLPMTDARQFIPQFPAHCRRLRGSDTSPTGSDTEGPMYWQIDCGPAGLRGAQVSVAGLDGSRTDVIVQITWLDGGTTEAVLRSGADHFTVAAGVTASSGVAGASVRNVLWSYGRLGVEHILYGADHLLFLLLLTLLVETWGVLAKTISAFTLAHSLALALATLGIVRVPAALVEALIALSIVLLAVELAHAAEPSQPNPPSLTRRYPWLVAFAFGLVHGLGFAGALAKIGLPPHQITIALLGFNLGVEAGQLLFILAVAAPLALWSHFISTSRARLIPAYTIGAVAAAWTFVRIQRFWM